MEFVRIQLEPVLAEVNPHEHLHQVSRILLALIVWRQVLKGGPALGSAAWPLTYQSAAFFGLNLPLYKAAREGRHVPSTWIAALAFDSMGSERRCTQEGCLLGGKTINWFASAAGWAFLFVFCWLANRNELVFLIKSIMGGDVSTRLELFRRMGRGRKGRSHPRFDSTRSNRGETREQAPAATTNDYARGGVCSSSLLCICFAMSVDRSTALCVSACTMAIGSRSAKFRFRRLLSTDCSSKRPRAFLPFAKPSVSCHSLWQCERIGSSPPAPRTSQPTSKTLTVLRNRPTRILAGRVRGSLLLLCVYRRINNNNKRRQPTIQRPRHTTRRHQLLLQSLLPRQAGRSHRSRQQEQEDETPDDGSTHQRPQAPAAVAAAGMAGRGGRRLPHPPAARSSTPPPACIVDAEGRRQR